MIMQLSHQVAGCPICGRPVEVKSEYVGRELACGHCQGHFVLSETCDGGLSTAATHGISLLERANRLLRWSGRRTDFTASDQTDRWPESSVRDNSDRSQCIHETFVEDDCQPSDEQQPTMLLVEHRDEVFARVATDMALTGSKIIRARSATEALKLCGTYEPALVVANLDLPDQSGWLLAGKLQFIDGGVRVWLYHHQSRRNDERTAEYLQVDEFLDYGGDLLGLSETIVELLTDWHEPTSAVHDPCVNFNTPRSNCRKPQQEVPNV